MRILATVVWLMGLLSGCEDALLEPDSGAELMEPDFDQAALKKGLGGVNGATDYCNNPASQCVGGEGDCDVAFPCAAGFICGLDNGSNFGFSIPTDVCVIAACDNNIQDGAETGVDCGTVDCGLTCPNLCAGVDPVNGGVSHCTTGCPCGPGGGDCDGSTQCLAGLTCAIDVGLNYGFTEATDVCEGTLCANGLLDGDETGVDCGGSCDACAANATWAQALGNANHNTTTEIAVDLVDGSIYVAGQFTGTLNSGAGNLVSAGSLDFFVVKYDVNGVPLWAKSYGGTAADGDGFVGLAVDPVSRRLAIVSNFQGTDDFGGGNLTAVNGYDGILIVLDSAGAFVAARRYGDVGTDQLIDVSWDRFGALYVGGTFATNINLGGATLVTAGGVDIAAAKFNSALTHVWSTAFGGTGTDTLAGLTADYNGRPLLVGGFSATATFGATQLVSAGLTDMYVMRLISGSGAVDFVQGYGSPGTDVIQAVATDNASNLYAVGGFKRTVDFGGGPVIAAGGSDKLDGFVLALDATGNFRWVRQMGSTEADTFSGVAVNLNSSDLVVSGYFSLTLTGFDETGSNLVSAGSLDGIVMTIDSATGNTQKVETFGSAGIDYAESVARRDANIEVLGNFTNSVTLGGIAVTSAGLSDALVGHFVTF